MKIGQSLVLFSAVGLAIASPAFGAEYRGYIIKLKSDAQHAQSESILSGAGVEIVSRIPELGILISRNKGNLDSESTLRSMSSVVEYIEPNYIVKATMGKSKDPYFEADTLWGMKAVNAKGAWQRGVTGNKSVVVAVSDTGIYAHEELVPNLWKNPREIPKNKIDDDGNGLVDDITGWNYTGKGSATTNDDQGHGTHVAGTIGAKGGNGFGIVGVNWDVSLMALKFLDAQGSGTTEGGIRTIVYAADNGAKVLNASWGGDGYSQALWDAIEYAKNRGMLVIAAAGNDSTDNDKKPHYPSNYNNENVISVSAMEHLGQRLAWFSNFGALTVHLSAPGDLIRSTWNPMLNQLSRDLYKDLSGTSMAAPHVSGAAALVYAANPNLNWRQVKEILLTTVTATSKQAGKSITGGILNVDAAVQRAIELR
jgi:subtilisin family serine protease